MGNMHIGVGDFGVLGEAQKCLERHIGVAKTILEQLADKVDTRLPAKLDAKTRAVIRTAVDETVTEAFNAVSETMREDATADDEEWKEF